MDIINKETISNSKLNSNDTRSTYKVELRRIDEGDYETVVLFQGMLGYSESKK